MDIQGKATKATRNQSHDKDVIANLGDAPALIMGDTRRRPPDKRAVNLRWLSGTVLTGCTSITLMGVALLAALNGQHQQAIPSSAFIMAKMEALQNKALDELNFGKSDRIIPIIQQQSNKQVLQVSTVTHVEGKDFIKMRPFAHISTALIAHPSKAEANIPAFNPLDIFSDAGEPIEHTASDSIYSAQVDGQILIEMSDFPLTPSLQNTEVAFDLEEVRETLLTQALPLLDTAAPFPIAAYAPAGQFNFPRQPNDIFQELGVRIITENVTNFAKSDEKSNLSVKEELLTIHNGDTLRKLLRSVEILPATIKKIIVAFQKINRNIIIKPGQKLRLALAPDENDTNHHIPIRVSLYEENGHILTVALNDNGIFTNAPEPSSIRQLSTNRRQVVVKEGNGPTATIHDSIYATAQTHDISKELASDLIKIYAFDIDLQRHTHSNDSIELLYSMEEPGPVSTGRPEILFTSITIANNTRRFYRFRTADDGLVDYYDATGKSAKKFLMRKPVASGRFRSGFGMRRHPILGYSKMHTGVDWSAPRGTPIMAAGNGVILEAKWKSGYGRWIKIHHTNGYETAYAHMKGWAKGIKAGKRVRQGQIIGYVGSTGLSTGPHLHYEVTVNGRRVNPMRIRLPRGRILKGKMLEAFLKEHERINALIEKNKSNTKTLARS